MRSSGGLRAANHVLFGSAFAVCAMVIMGHLQHGRDAPNLFRPQEGNALFVVALLSGVSAAFSVVLALLDARFGPPRF